MKKTWLASFLLGWGLLAEAQERFMPTPTNQKTFYYVLNLLKNYHYQPQALADVAGDIHREYLDLLDPNHLYFLASDVADFQKYQNNLLDLRKENLEVPFAIHNVYTQRAEALHHWTIERLQKPFDLTTNETITYPDSRDKTPRPYFETLEALHEHQEKRLTEQLIRLMLSGKTEERARQMLADRYKSALKSMKQQTAQDVFDMYVNALTTRFDPHTNYLSPRHSEDFDISMKLSLEGIGATLTLRDEKIQVRDLIVGSPASKSSLKLKDHILGVAQGKDGEMVDVVGWRLDKAVDLIRGKKGTVVRLLVESDHSGEIKEVSLVRDTIKLEEQAATATVEELNGKKIGLIHLPSFYLDFEGRKSGKKDYRSTAQDVKKILQNFKKEKVDGVLIDLRGNGGGALAEAIDTVGLFIDEGAVVAVADKKNTAYQKDEDKGTSYDGPLGVLIDMGSASASEIFAAAIQDYQRGVIIGNNSFGKGTVQSMIDLSRFGKNKSEKLGNMKFTTAMFHRVNGGSTQLKGVQPDVALPEPFELEQVGEVALDYALKWQEIEPAKIRTYNQINGQMIGELKRLHDERITQESALQRYQERVKELQQQSKQLTWSLNLSQREQEYQQRKDARKLYERLQRESIPALKVDERTKKRLNEQNLFVDEKKGEEIQDFVPDVDLFEGLNIFADYINLLGNQQKGN